MSALEPRRPRRAVTNARSRTQKRPILGNTLVGAKGSGSGRFQSTTIDACLRAGPLCQTSCRLNRIGTLGARIAESGSIRTSVQGPDSGEAVAAGEFVGGARIA